jgi:hypothetical protein
VVKISDIRLPNWERRRERNSARLYTGPKGERFEPTFGKSGDFWVGIVEVRKNLQGIFGGLGESRETARLAITQNLLKK